MENHLVEISAYCLSFGVAFVLVGILHIINLLRIKTERTEDDLQKAIKDREFTGPIVLFCAIVIIGGQIGSCLAQKPADKIEEQKSIYIPSNYYEEEVEEEIA